MLSSARGGAAGECWLVISVGCGRLGSCEALGVEACVGVYRGRGFICRGGEGGG